MSAANDTPDRLLRLETAVAHLQHDFEQVHEVALELQNELRQLAGQIARLEHQLQRLQEPSEERSLPDERPPHY